MASDVTGVLTLTCSRRDDEVAVSLGVGLVLPEVERLIAEWHGESPGERYTVFGNVGYLRPARRWVDTRFSEDRPIDEGVREIVALVMSEAVPFLEEHGSLKGAAALIENELFPGLERINEELLPVIYALDGDEARAAAALAAIVDSFDPDDLWALPWRHHAYVDGFRKAFPDIR